MFGIYRLGHMIDHSGLQALFGTLLKWIRPRKGPADASAPETGKDEKPAAAAEDPTVMTESKSRADKEALPTTLPGFDLDEGLKRLQGNQQLYKKLLMNFADGYSNTTHDIRQAVDSADYEAAHQLVHSLKGVAANLAAGRLRQTTVEIEKLVKHANPESPPDPASIDAGIDALKDALDQVLGAVETLKAGNEALPFEPAAESSAPLVAVDKQAMLRLREAAEMGDVTEVVSIADKIASLSDDFSPYRAKIVQLADDFDFDAILQLADRLENDADGTDA